MNWFADQDDVEFAELLKTLRVDALLTQEDLSHRSGLSVHTISDLERGRVTRPRISTVRLLADALALVGAARSRFQRASFRRRDKRS